MRIVPASLLRQLPDLDQLLDLKAGYKTLFLAPLECHVLHTTLRCILDYTESQGNTARLPLRFLAACKSTLQSVNAALGDAKKRSATQSVAPPSQVGPANVIIPTEVLPVHVHCQSASMAAWCTSILIGQSPSLLQSGLMSVAHQITTWPGHIWDQGKFTLPWVRAATWRFPRRSQLTPPSAGEDGGGVKNTLSSLGQTLLLTTHRTALQALMDAQESTQRPSAAAAAASPAGAAAAAAAVSPWATAGAVGDASATTNPQNNSDIGVKSGDSSSADSNLAAFAGVEPGKMSLAVAITGAAVAGFVCTNVDNTARHCISNVMMANQNLLSLMAAGMSPQGVMALLTGEAASWPRAARNLGDIPARNALASLFAPIQTPWNPVHSLRPDAGHGFEVPPADLASERIVALVSPCDMLQTVGLPTYSPPGCAAAPGAASWAHGTPLHQSAHAELVRAMEGDRHVQSSSVMRGVPLFASVYARGSLDVWVRSGVFPVCHAFALHALRPHLYGVQVAVGAPAAALQSWLAAGDASLGPVVLVSPSCVQISSSGPPPGADESETGATPAAEEPLESSLTVGSEFETDFGDSSVPGTCISGIIAKGLAAGLQPAVAAGILSGVHCATAKLHPSMNGLDSVPAPSTTVRPSAESEAVQWCSAGLSVVISKGSLTGRIGWVTGVADKSTEQLFVRVLPPVSVVNEEQKADSAAAAAEGGAADPDQVEAGPAEAQATEAAVDAAAAADIAAPEAAPEAEPAVPLPADAAEVNLLDLSDLLPGTAASPGAGKPTAPVGDWPRPSLESFTTILPVSSLKPHRPGPSSFARLIKGEHKDARVLVLNVAHGPERLMLCADVDTGELFTQRKDRVAAERSFEEVLAAEQRIRDVWLAAKTPKEAGTLLAELIGTSSSSKPIPLYSPMDLPAHDMEQLVNMYASKHAATGLGNLGRLANPVAGRDARVLASVQHGSGSSATAVLCLYHRQEVTAHDDATLVSPLAADGALPADVQELESDEAAAVITKANGWVTRMQQAVTLRGGRITHLRYESMKRCVVAAWEGADESTPPSTGQLPPYGIITLPLSSANGEVLSAGSMCVQLPAAVTNMVGVLPWAGCRLGVGFLVALLADGSMAVCSRGAQVLLHIVPADQVQALVTTARGIVASSPVSVFSVLDDRASPIAATHGMVGNHLHQGAPVFAVLCGDEVGLLSAHVVLEYPRLQAAAATDTLLPDWLPQLASCAGDNTALAESLKTLSPAEWRAVTAALAPQAGPCKPSITHSAVFGPLHGSEQPPPQLGYEDAEVTAVHRIDGSREIVFRADCAKHSSPIPAAGGVARDHPSLAPSPWTPPHSFVAGLRLPALTAMHRLFVRACVTLTVRADAKGGALANALQRECLSFNGKHAYSPGGGYMLLQLAGRSLAQAAEDEYSNIFSSLGGNVAEMGQAHVGALTLAPPAAPNSALMDMSDDLAAMCTQSTQPVATLLAAQSRGVPLALPESFMQHREFCKTFSDSDNAMVPTATNDLPKGWTIEAWVCPGEGTFTSLPETWNPSAERLDPRSQVCGASLHIQPIVDLGESQGVGVAFPIAPGFAALIHKQDFGMMWRKVGTLPGAGADEADSGSGGQDITPVSKWHSVVWGTAVYRRQTDQLAPGFLPQKPGVYEIALMPKPTFASGETQAMPTADVQAAFDEALCTGVFASVPNASLPGDVAQGMRALQQDMPRANVHSLRTVLETTTGDGSVIAVALSTAGHVHVVCQHPFMHSVLRYGGEATADGTVRIPFVPSTNGAGASVAALASNLPGENTVTRPSLSSARDPSWHGQSVMEAGPPAYDVFAPRVPKGAWSHIALRLHADTAEVSLLVNGRPYSRRCRPGLCCASGDMEPAPVPGKLPTAARHSPALVRIGGSVMGDTFHGHIANVRVWGTHVPSRQVQRTMHGPLAPARPATPGDCGLEYLGLRWAHSLQGTSGDLQYGLAPMLQRCWPSHATFSKGTKGEQGGSDLATALSSCPQGALYTCTGPPVDLCAAGLSDAVAVVASVETSAGQGYLTDTQWKPVFFEGTPVPLQKLGVTQSTPLFNAAARNMRVSVQLSLRGDMCGAQAQLVACHVGTTGVEVHQAARHLVEASTAAGDIPRALARAASYVQAISAHTPAVLVAAWRTATEYGAEYGRPTSAALRLIQRLGQTLLDDSSVTMALAPVLTQGGAWGALVDTLLLQAPTNEDAMLGGALLLGAVRASQLPASALEEIQMAALKAWELCSTLQPEHVPPPAAVRCCGALITWCTSQCEELQSKAAGTALSVLLKTLESTAGHVDCMTEVADSLIQVLPGSSAAIKHMVLPQWAHLQLHARPLLVHPHAAVAGIPRYGSYDSKRVAGAIMGAQVPPQLMSAVPVAFDDLGSTIDEVAAAAGGPSVALRELLAGEGGPESASWGSCTGALQEAAAGKVRISCTQLALKHYGQVFTLDLDAQRVTMAEGPSGSISAPPTTLTGFDIDIHRPDMCCNGTIIVSLDAIPAGCSHVEGLSRQNHTMKTPELATHCADNMLSRWSPEHTLGHVKRAQWASTMNSASHGDSSPGVRALIDPQARLLQLRAASFSLLSRPVPDSGVHKYVFFVGETGASSSFTNLFVALCNKEQLFPADSKLTSTTWTKRTGLEEAEESLLLNSIVLHPARGEVSVPDAFLIPASSGGSQAVVPVDPAAPTATAASADGTSTPDPNLEKPGHTLDTLVTAGDAKSAAASAGPGYTLLKCPGLSLEAGSGHFIALFVNTSAGTVHVDVNNTGVFSVDAAQQLPCSISAKGPPLHPAVGIDRWTSIGNASCITFQLHEVAALPPKDVSTSRSDSFPDIALSPPGAIRLASIAAGPLPGVQSVTAVANPAELARATDGLSHGVSPISVAPAASLYSAVAGAAGVGGVHMHVPHAHGYNVTGSVSAPSGSSVPTRVSLQGLGSLATSIGTRYVQVTVMLVSGSDPADTASVWNSEITPVNPADVSIDLTLYGARVPAALAQLSATDALPDWAQATSLLPSPPRQFQKHPPTNSATQEQLVAAAALLDSACHTMQHCLAARTEGELSYLKAAIELLSPEQKAEVSIAALPNTPACKTVLRELWFHAHMAQPALLEALSYAGAAAAASSSNAAWSEAHAALRTSITQANTLLAASRRATIQRIATATLVQTPPQHMPSLSKAVVLSTVSSLLQQEASEPRDSRLFDALASNMLHAFLRDNAGETPESIVCLLLGQLAHVDAADVSTGDSPTQSVRATAVSVAAAINKGYTLLQRCAEVEVQHCTGGAVAQLMKALTSPPHNTEAPAADAVGGLLVFLLEHAPQAIDAASDESVAALVGHSAKSETAARLLRAALGGVVLPSSDRSFAVVKACVERFLPVWLQAATKGFSSHAARVEAVFRLVLFKVGMGPRRVVQALAAGEQGGQVATLPQFAELIDLAVASSQHASQAKSLLEDILQADISSVSHCTQVLTEKHLLSVQPAGSDTRQLQRALALMEVCLTACERKAASIDAAAVHSRLPEPPSAVPPGLTRSRSSRESQADVGSASLEGAGGSVQPPPPPPTASVALKRSATAPVYAISREQAKDKTLLSVAPHVSAVRAAVVLLCKFPLPAGRTHRPMAGDAITLSVWATALKLISSHKDATSGRMDGIGPDDVAALVVFLTQQSLLAPAAFRGLLSVQIRAVLQALLLPPSATSSLSDIHRQACVHCATAAVRVLVSATAEMEVLQLAARTQRTSADTKSSTYGQSNPSIIVRNSALQTHTSETTSQAAYALALLQALVAPLCDSSNSPAAATENAAAVVLPLLQAVKQHLDWQLDKYEWSDGASQSGMQLADCTLQSMAGMLHVCGTMLQSTAHAGVIAAEVATWMQAAAHVSQSAVFSFVAWAVLHCINGSHVLFSGNSTWQDVLSGKSALQVLNTPVVQGISGGLLNFAEHLNLWFAVQGLLLRLLCQLAEKNPGDAFAMAITDTCKYMVACVQSGDAVDTMSSSDAASTAGADASLAALLKSTAGGMSGQSPSAPMSRQGLRRCLLYLNNRRDNAVSMNNLHDGFMPVLMLLLASAMKQSPEVASTTLAAVMDVLGAEAPESGTATEHSLKREAISSVQSEHPLAELELGMADVFGSAAADGIRATKLLQADDTTLPLRLNKNTSDAIKLQGMVDALLQAAATSTILELPAANDALSVPGDMDLISSVFPLGVPKDSTASNPRHKAVFPGILQVQDALHPHVKAPKPEVTPMHSLTENTRDVFRADEMLFVYNRASLTSSGLGTIAAGGDVCYFTFFAVLHKPCRLSHIELAFADARDVAAPMSVILSAGPAATELVPAAHIVTSAAPSVTPIMTKGFDKQRNNQSSKDNAVFSKHASLPSASQFALFQLRGSAPVQVLMFTCLLSESAAPRSATELFGSLKHFYIVGTPCAGGQPANKPAASPLASAVVSASGALQRNDSALPAELQANSLRKSVVEPFLDFLGERMSAAPFILGTNQLATDALPADVRLFEALESRRDAVHAALKRLSPQACVQATMCIWGSMQHFIQPHVRSGEDKHVLVELTGWAHVQRAVALLGNLAWHQPAVRNTILQRLAEWVQAPGVDAGSGTSVHMRAVLATAAVQLLPVIIAAQAADSTVTGKEWHEMGVLMSMISDAVEGILSDVQGVNLQPAHVLAVLPLLESFSQVLHNCSEVTARHLPAGKLACLVVAAEAALARCCMGTQLYKTLLTFVCAAHPHIALFRPLSSVARDMLAIGASDAQKVLHHATGSHAAFNGVVQGCAEGSIGSAAAALVHAAASMTAGSALAPPSQHLTALAHLAAMSGIVAAGAECFRLLQGAVQLLHWCCNTPDATFQARGKAAVWQLPTTANPPDGEQEGGQAESKDDESLVRVVWNPLTQLCAALATEGCTAHQLLLSTAALAAFTVSTASDDSTVAQWAGSELVASVMMCVASGGEKPASAAPLPVLAVVPAALRPLHSLLEVLIQAHDGNKQLAVTTASDAVAGSHTLSPSLLSLFRLLSTTSAQSFVSVTPSPGVDLLTPAVLALVKAADDAFQVEQLSVQLPVGGAGVPVSQWGAKGVTPAQKALVLGSDSAGRATAAALLACSTAAFSTDKLSHTDRVELDESTCLTVQHTGTTNANALVNLPISRGAGVFRVTYRLDSLKGDDTIGASAAGLCVSIGVSPVRSPENVALSCASMQYMVDQKDANCYDGSNDVGDFREAPPFVCVGDTFTIIVDANEETFGFVGSNGEVNVAFTDIYSRIVDKQFSKQLYPAVFFYSSQSGKVTLLSVELLKPPSDPSCDSVTEWQVAQGNLDVEGVAAALGGGGLPSGGAAYAASPLQPHTLPPRAAVATRSGLAQPIAPQNLVVGADATPFSAAVPLGGLTAAQWGLLATSTAPHCAWRAPLPLLPVPACATIASVAAAMHAKSRYLQWNICAVLPTVVEVESDLPATGAGDSISHVACGVPYAWSVPTVSPGTDKAELALGMALRALGQLQHTHAMEAAAQLTTALPESVSRVLASVTASDAPPSAPRVLQLSFVPMGSPWTPLHTPTPASASGPADAGFEERKEGKHTTAATVNISKPHMNAFESVLDALASASGPSAVPTAEERTMLSWLNEAGILAKLLKLIQQDVPRAFGVHPALLVADGDPETAPALQEGTFQLEDECFAADRGDSWKSVKEVWLEHAASLHSWLRDALALLDNPATGKVVAADASMQGMLQLLLEAYGKLSSVPADVFRGFNMSAKRGGDAHWTGLAAQLVPGVQVKGFLRPKADPLRLAALNAALVRAGLSEASAAAGAAGGKTAAGGGVLLLANGKALQPAQKASDMVHPEQGTIALGNDPTYTQAVVALGRSSGAKTASTQAVRVSADDTAHPVATLLRPVLTRVLGAARTKALFSDGTGATPAKSASTATATQGGLSPTVEAGDASAAVDTPLTPAVGSAEADSTEIAATQREGKGLVAALASSPSLLAALLQRVGECQGFTAADEATQLEQGDCITYAQKRAKALAAAKRAAEKQAAEEKAADATSGGNAEAGATGTTGAKKDDKSYWTAGTGYSYDGQKGLRDFDAAALETKRQQRQAASAAVLELLTAVIRADTEDSATGEPSSQVLLQCIANSPVLAVLASFLRSTEIDIAKQPDVHSAVYAVCHALAEHSVLRTVLLPATDGGSSDLVQLLEDSKGLADDVLEPAEGGEGGEKSLEPPVRAAMESLQAAAVAASVAAESIRTERAEAAAATAASGEGAPAADDEQFTAGAADDEQFTAGAAAAGHGMQALKDLYVSTMKKLAFGKEDMTKSGALTAFKYRTSLDSEGKAPASRVTGTKQQLRALKGSMPLDFDATVFLRHDKRRPYVIEFMIAAPPDTPYDSGLFLFHLYCDPSFPKQSPKVNLQTTGGASVRFNPNLYASGKVCLSLLGTWHGGNSREAWTPDSTLLQVLVSILALIFVKYPYYNEPGVEKEQGTDRGLRNQRVAENGGYERLRVGTVQWAIVDMLRNPPKGFEEVVKQHFLMKRPHILETCEQWLKEASDDGTPGQHAKLQKQVEAAKAELANLGDGPAERMLAPQVTEEEQAAQDEAGAAAAAAAAASSDTAGAKGVPAAAAADTKAAEGGHAKPALSKEAERLKMICPQYPDGMYTYAITQNKGVEAAALWLVDKGEAHFTANAEKYLS